MNTHGSVAASVRANRERYPELYCKFPRCLWRTGGPRGTPCGNHPIRTPAPTDDQDQQSGTLIADLQASLAANGITEQELHESIEAHREAADVRTHR